MKFAHTVETTAPPEKIWAAWTDVKRWPEWDTELASASLEGSFALGAKGKLKPKRGPAARFSISELIPGESYTFTTRLPLCELKVRRHLTLKDGGACFTHEVSFVGPLSTVFANLLGRRYREALPVVMENLRNIAES
jgi:Polyketide cyclase / dehydrase and lipid transport